MPPRAVLWLAAALLLPQVAVAAELREASVTELVPQRGDHTLLSWREGPPYFTTARYSAERRFLRLETGHFSAEFDTVRSSLTGFAHHTSPRDDAAAAHAALEAASLPEARLHLRIQVGGVSYACTGRSPLRLDPHQHPAAPLQFPVRIVESGRFFQKFALHDLEFTNDDGAKLAAVAWLEIAAWPDRLTLILVIRPDATLPAAHTFLRLQTAGGMDASRAESPQTWTAGQEHRSALTLGADGSALAPAAPADIALRVSAVSPRDRAEVRWNGEELGHAIQLQAAPWPEIAEGHYPEPMLDAWERYAVSVENASATPQRLALCFDHTPIKAITGYVPMILDSAERPAGVPVQISKNWHLAAEGTDLPHAGQWMHGRTWLNVPPRSRVTFRYGTTFARWGGVPAASLAQLSLIGWGHNGFWDQLALGSFGESFCFQPGRVMRRALFTDFRPLLQRGFARDERWAWTSNVGGGDTMVRHDANGRYVPFKRNATRYASYGPNLAHLIHDEISADLAIRGHTEVFLPRTDDHVRVYLRIRYDVDRPVAFSRVAFFQFGADHYNEPDAPLVAWGNAERLAVERRPHVVTGRLAVAPWAAEGVAPWISLHGEARTDSARTGQAGRGLILRHWQAVLAGRAVPAPYFAATGSRGNPPRLAAEIAAPPALNALARGDYVDMLLELVALPLAADRYYGPDAAVRAALASDANTWKLVQREARDNQPTLRLGNGEEVSGWPLTVALDDHRSELGFTLHGGLGWVPVRITGLAAPHGLELHRVTRAGREPVVQGDPTRAFWQCDYDAGAQRWSITYNLPASASPASYVAIVRETIPLAVSGRP